MDDIFTIPIFLYQVMYILFSSAIPILIMLVLIRLIVRSGKKLIRTTLD